MTPTKSSDGDSPSHQQEDDIESYFPFPGYRKYQREILHEAKEALFDTPSINTVVIDAPTGIGKSGINIALANYADMGAFYTTPQKKLRDQLSHDEMLADYHSILRSRRDYTCHSTPQQYAESGKTYNCQNCPVKSRNDVSCQQVGCVYWVAKEEAMEDSVATLTFAFLIVDNRLPSHSVMVNGDSVRRKSVKVGDNDVVETNKISFDKREVLVIDEAHTLAEQVTSLHAGIKLTPWTIKAKPIGEYSAGEGRKSSGETAENDPYNVFSTTLHRLLQNTPKSIDTLSVGELTTVLSTTKTAIDEIRSKLDARQLNEKGGNKKSQFDSISWKIGNVLDDIEYGNPWVVTGESSTADKKEYQIELYPVWADTFLRQNVWNRAEKVILSTATLPHRDNPSKWLRRIGRDPEKAKIISKPMPFPVENRPVRLDYQIGSMSNGGIQRHWDKILQQIRELSDTHKDEKGLVHTASYDRAERLHEALPDLTMPHRRSDSNVKAVIDKWQQSDKQLLLSPSMTEGVDLEGDLCRWQILLKVPLRTLSDPRVEYLVREQNNWEWYNDVAAREIIQSIGRAVRSPDDYATYYVFDSKFDDVMKGRTPTWLSEAFVRS